MKTLIVFSLFSLLTLFTFTALVLAQPGLPGPPSQAPIDGGLGLLAAAGGVYAYKKLREKEPKKRSFKRRNNSF